jgi:hypothetical protein
VAADVQRGQDGAQHGHAVCPDGISVSLSAIKVFQGLARRGRGEYAQHDANDRAGQHGGYRGYCSDCQ